MSEEREESIETIKTDDIETKEKIESDKNEEIETKGKIETNPSTDKINILLKATSNAPILKNATWNMSGGKTIGNFSLFLRKYMKLKPSDSLFLYVNQMFAPTPDQTFRNLYECFNYDGKLVLHYCMTPAWG